MTIEEDFSINELCISLPKSLANENLTDVLATIGDAGLDAIIDSGSLDGVPFLGILTGILKAKRSVENELYFRKIYRFLLSLESTSVEDRVKFVNELTRKGKMEEFGETILLLLERIDDIKKPSIIGNIMAAHISGHLAYDKAMRLAAIVNKCYSQDLGYLQQFREGTQGNMYYIADALFSVGLLANIGIDGGNAGDPNSGGAIYSLNEYGKLLVKYGWPKAP